MKGEDLMSRFNTRGQCTVYRMRDATITSTCWSGFLFSNENVWSGLCVKNTTMKTGLCSWRQVSVNVVYLLFEAFVQHLVCFIKDQHFNGTSPQIATFDHVYTQTILHAVSTSTQAHEPTKHSSWSSRHNVLPVVQLPDVFTNIGASDARMTLNAHVVSKSQDNLTTTTCDWTDRTAATQFREMLTFTFMSV